MESRPGDCRDRKDDGFGEHKMEHLGPAIASPLVQCRPPKLHVDRASDSSTASTSLSEEVLRQRRDLRDNNPCRVNCWGLHPKAFAQLMKTDCCKWHELSRVACMVGPIDHQCLPPFLKDKGGQHWSYWHSTATFK